MRKIKLFILFLLLIGTKTYAAGVYNWTGEKDVGNWTGSKQYEDGWSEWSTSVPSGVTMYVKAAVYLPVSSWRDEGCSTSSKQVITLGSFVRKEEGSYTKYNTSYSIPYTACNSYNDVTHQTDCGACGCELDYSDPTGGCIKQGGKNWCNSKNVDYASCGTLGYTNPCYYIHYPSQVTKYNSGCNSGYSGDSNEGCGSERHYCYKTSSSFLDVNNKSNWRTSVSAAGGYAKKVYVYSYPQRVYINYEGNGATSICGNGDYASWTSGTNTYNSNTSIKYYLGNPVCSTSFTNKSMSSASNTNSTTYISAASGGTLKENEYYRIGYDFKGWSTTAGGSVKFKDKQSVTASQLSARGGDTITLYAVWEKHNYQVTYSYLCGSISDVTYQYGTGVTLKDLNTASCESGSNTKFLGWFEDIGYTKKLGSIPTNYYRDITLYAKERQVRYNNRKIMVEQI